MGNMRILCAGVLLLTLILPLFTSVEGRFHFARSHQVLGSNSYAHVPRKYDRIEEAKSACKEIIDSASELASDDNRAYVIRNHLSFSGGDWDQQSGTTRPLLPYLDYIGSKNSDVSILGSPVKLSGFQFTDVNFDHRTKKTVAVNGVLDLVITRNGFEQTESAVSAPQFQIWTGYTQASLFFQGVYTESKENGGERVMCLLGSAMLPVLQSDSNHPRGNLSTMDSMNYQPPLKKDDQILLVIRYPMKLSLTQRAIQGEMRSLSSKTNLKYFDKVRISSQSSTEDYKFDSEAVHKACDPYPYKDTLLEGGIDLYKGNAFCSLFEAIQRRGNAYIIPNWRCKGADEFCSRLGPFVIDSKKKIGSHGVFADVHLLTQNVHCEQKLIKGNVTEASVSLVLRVVPSQGDFYLQRRRSGLGNMTLAAEGVWNSSSGQLCMVGCLGIADACDSRLCFYIPTTFTINQRNILVGSISSIKAKTSSFSPLSFEIPYHYQWIWQELYEKTSLRYTYSKIDGAGALMDRDDSSRIGKLIKKSLSKYPKIQENEDYNSSLSLLAKDLTFHVSAVLNPTPSSSPETIFVYMEIFSVGSVIYPSSRVSNFSYTRVRTPYHEKAEYTEKQLLLNVSAQLSFRSVVFSNLSSLLLEGLYVPHVGKMYLIGCHDVRAQNISETNDLEGGFDCLTEVVISYPPVTGQWLLHPGAEISITSKRPEDDPLHFKPLKLKTNLITYRSQRESFLSERQTEGVLRVLTLSVMVVCILLQLLYIRNAADVVPYVSLVMLGIQSLGYALPLITSMESLFKRKNAVTESSYRMLQNETGQLDSAIGLTEKLLVLSAFLLTLRLFQKVWKSRVRFLRRVSQEPHHVPNDKLVLIITSVIHLAGFVSILFVHHTGNTSQAFEEMHPIDEFNQDGSFLVSMSSDAPIQWMVLLEEYMGVVQDLFLLPQVVGNLVWQVDTKPLRKLYYIGLSFVRIFPHVYDYFKASMLNPYFSTDYALINQDTDFYSKFSDVVIPVMTALLAVFVLVQQRWSYYKISDTLIIGRCRLLPLPRKVYQKLPSESIEAELASGEHKTNARDQEA